MDSDTKEDYPADCIQHETKRVKEEALMKIRAPPPAEMEGWKQGWNENLPSPAEMADWMQGWDENHFFPKQTGCRAGMRTPSLPQQRWQIGCRAGIRTTFSPSRLDAALR